MSNPPSSATRDDEIVARFLLDQEKHGPGVLLDYLDRYPELADRLHGLVKTAGRLDASRPDVEWPAPVRLEDFVIRRSIGCGGMGEVYEAEQKTLQRRVALKVIRPGRDGPEARARFFRERLVLARLHHTHIVPIFVAGEQDGRPFFVMPFIDGATLSEVIATARRLPPAQSASDIPSLAKLARGAHPTPATSQAAAGLSTTTTPQAVPERAGAEAVEPSATGPSRPRMSRAYFRSVATLLAQAADALQATHAANFVHRDCKPSNLMIDIDGQCRIIDFGLAGRLGEVTGSDPAAAPAALAAPLTSGQLLGTPEYMAPEQTEGHADVRSDVWGLGATLYELLTLRRPFLAGNRQELFQKIRSAEPVRPRQLAGGVPYDLQAVCLKALSKDPGRRYPSAGAFAADLRRWLVGEPTRAGRAGPARRLLLWSRRNKGWTAAIVLTFTALAALGLLIIKAETDRAVAALRESLRNQLQRIRLTPHTTYLVENEDKPTRAWSDDAWDLVRQATKFRASGDDLPSEAAATLLGLDAHLPRPPIQGDASGVAWDPEGKRLVLGGWETERARLYDPQTGTVPVRSRHGSRGPVCFRADGTPIQIVPQPDLSLMVWDVAGETTVSTCWFERKPDKPGHDGMEHTAIALSPDGTLVAAAVADPEDRKRKGIVAVWETNSSNRLLQMAEKATALAIDPENRTLAVGDEDGQITLVPLHGGKQVPLPRAGRTRIHCLAFQRDPHHRDRGDGGKPEPGWLLASGDAGGSVVVWDLETRIPRTICPGSPHGVHHLAFSPDQMTLASTGRRETRLWDVATGRPVLTISAGNFLSGLAFSPDGRRLAVSSITQFGYPGEVCVWDLEPGRGLHSLRGLTAQVAKVCYSADGHRIAALAHNWEAAIWEAETGRLLARLDVPKGYYADNAALAFNAAGGRFAFSSGQEAKLWEVPSGRVLGQLLLPPGYQDNLAFPADDRLLLFRVESPDGKQHPFAVPRPPHVCRTRNLLGADPTEAIYPEIREFERGVQHSLTSADGRFYVVDGVGKEKKRTIAIFDGLTGEPLLAIPSTQGEKSSHMALDPPARLLTFVGDEFKTTTLVEVPSGKLVRSTAGAAEALGPRATYRAREIEQAPGQTCVGLMHRDDQTPCVLVGIDQHMSSHIHFNPAGTHLAWGNADGTVTVCDIAEVRHRLASVGLGW